MKHRKECPSKLSHVIHNSPPTNLSTSEVTTTSSLIPDGANQRRLINCRRNTYHCRVTESPYKTTVLFAKTCNHRLVDSSGRSQPTCRLCNALSGKLSVFGTEELPVHALIS